MSIHPIPSPTDDPADSIRWERLELVLRQCRLRIRQPENVLDDGVTLSLVFTPDLTPAEATILRRIISITGLLRITPAEWATIEASLDTARAYVNLASPNNAQTVAAVKSIVRVLRAILRD